MRTYHYILSINGRHLIRETEDKKRDGMDTKRYPLAADSSSLVRQIKQPSRCNHDNLTKNYWADQT